MRISSRTRRLRNISSVGARMCVCMCVDMTYDATIDTGGDRNRVCFTMVWGHEYVITSLLEIPV
jgi:hypothetical protein